MLQFAAAAATIFALARPQAEVVESSPERDGIAIEMLVDISSSMDMRMDYRGEESTRLEVAKEVLEQFVAGDGGELPGRDDDLIGIITFARYADTICPLTLGHEAVVYLAQELSINDRPNEDGTAYGDATALASARLRTLEESLWSQADAAGTDLREVKSKVIVLLTDGENNCGRHLPLESAALAKEWGIRIYTISLTDPPRMRRVETENGPLEVAEGRSSAERVLERMATVTGGVFRTAHDFDSLQAVYAEIDRLERSEMRTTVKRVVAERYQRFALSGLGLLAAGTLLGATWLRRAP